MYFKNRTEAGKLLAKSLEKYKNKDVIVYALPRGGVVTAYEIAKFLNTPLDLIITRKIGHPFEPEYAISAVAENGHIAGGGLNISTIDKKWFGDEVKKEQKEAQRRRGNYLSGRKPLSAKGKIAILVDDGIATGLTIRAGILELKHQKPEKIVVAVPVAPKDTADQIKKDVDELVVLDAPEFYSGAVGTYYEEFFPVEDEEVITILRTYEKKRAKTKSDLIKTKAVKKIVKINIENVVLEGQLLVPEDAKSIVLFAHGAGSSRHSSRNIFVADALNKAGFGTLLIDLLTEKEDEIYKTRFDIDLLTTRLVSIIHWLKQNSQTKTLNLGLFGASTGATGALKASAKLDSLVKAIVSRGGRPDLAMSTLDKVISPTLLIVGGNDFGVIELNQQALENLKSIKKLEIVSNATHLFEEPGALDEIARLATNWFKKYLQNAKGGRR